MKCLGLVRCKMGVMILDESSGAKKRVFTAVSNSNTYSGGYSTWTMTNLVFGELLSIRTCKAGCTYPEFLRPMNRAPFKATTLDLSCIFIKGTTSKVNFHLIEEKVLLIQKLLRAVELRHDYGDHCSTCNAMHLSQILQDTHAHSIFYIYTYLYLGNCMPN